MIDLTITSDPDKDGNYRLQCPQCLISFFASIAKDDKTGELYRTSSAIIVITPPNH